MGKTGARRSELLPNLYRRIRPRFAQRVGGALSRNAARNGQQTAVPYGGTQENVFVGECEAGVSDEHGGGHQDSGGAPRGCGSRIDGGGPLSPTLHLPRGRGRKEVGCGRSALSGSY